MAELDATSPDTTATPDASPAPSPSPATPAAEPSRRDVIREAVAAQKEQREPDIAALKPAQTAADRARGADGKFAPGVDRPAPDRTAAPSAATPAKAAPGAPAAAAPAQTAPAASDSAVVRLPPPGWSPASKVAFDALPESVKADIAKREREVDQGFAKLAEFKPVEKYVEMAKAGGTTLDRALEAYTGIETLLRRDVFAGIDQILRNVGIKNPRAFAQGYLQRVSGGSQTPGPQPDAQARQPAAIDPQAIVRQATDAVRAEHSAREAKGEVQRFAADPKNRFFANVQPEMARLAHGGFVRGATVTEQLQNAYDMACRMDPEIAKLINQPAIPDPRIAAAVTARGAARATTGAPSPGASPGAAATKVNPDRRQMIRDVVAAQRGGRA